MVSYEIALGLSLVGVLIQSGSFQFAYDCGRAGRGLSGIHSAVEYFSRAVHRIFHLSDGGLRGDEPHSV